MTRKAKVDRATSIRLANCFALVASGNFDPFSVLLDLTKVQNAIYHATFPYEGTNDDMADELAFSSTPLTGTECQTLANVITVANQMRVEGGCAGV